MKKTVQSQTEAEPPHIESDAMRLSEGNRLHFPRNVLRAVSWFSGDKNIDLLAELRAPGHVRLHDFPRANEKLQTLNAALLHDINNDAFDQFATLRDRYRPLVLYSDGRVRLTEVILVFLGATPPERPFLFVQGSHDCLDIMSLEYRNSRLERYRDDTALSSESSPISNYGVAGNET